MFASAPFYLEVLLGWYFFTNLLLGIAIILVSLYFMVSAIFDCYYESKRDQINQQLETTLMLAAEEGDCRICMKIYKRNEEICHLGCSH